MRRYATLAGYNAWANTRLYDTAALLPDVDYRADRGAFFKSIHGTLNHLLVTDRLWLGRFTAEPPAPYRLDDILFDDFDALHAARRMEDERILAFIEGLDEAALTRTFQYTRASTPDRYEQQLGPALDHLFNHQTHHRGQIHALLTAITGDAPSLDLLLFHREAGVGGMRQLPA